MTDYRAGMKTLYLNGILVGEVEATGDHQKDAEIALQFLKDKGLHRKSSEAEATMRQAVSFATTAAYLYKTDLSKSPWNGYSAAPFVVNSAFSIELYLKALARSHGKSMKGHELLKLFDQLPSGAHRDINAALPLCEQEMGSAGADLRTCIAELNNAFIEWRYCFEKYQTGVIRFDRMIFVMKVLHEAYRSNRRTT